MPSLSVVMIVRNEEGCLADCLASVRAIADEVVVGDTGSDDTTVSVAEGCGARVISLPWNRDFADARNRVLEQARGDWLLHLDADEVLDPHGAARVRRLVDEDGAGADAVEVTLANYSTDLRAWRWVPCEADAPYARGFPGYIQTELLRLFRNGRGFRYREPVHESITESVRERGGIVRREPIVIHHYGHTSGRPDSAKARLYLEIARGQVERNPRDPKAGHDLAEQLLAVGETDEAEAACRRVLEVQGDHLGAATTLANILCNRGALEEARHVLEGLIQVGHDRPHVRTALGAIACREGRIDEARFHLERARAAAPRHVLALLQYARVLDVADDSDRARYALEIAADVAPGIAEVADRLEAHRLRGEGERLARDGRRREGLVVLVDALKRDPEDPLIHRALGRTLTDLGLPERARESYVRAHRLCRALAPPE